MFFTYDQNNSGGSFDVPAEYVVVEAVDYVEANYLAERYGLYFNGCDDGLDCPCCGDRWYSQYSNEDGTEVPSVYGKPLTDPTALENTWTGGSKTAVVYYKNGTVEKY